MGNYMCKVFQMRGEKECGSLFANSTLLSFLWQDITPSDICLANEDKKPTSVKNLPNRSFQRFLVDIAMVSFVHHYMISIGKKKEFLVSLFLQRYCINKRSLQVKIFKEMEKILNAKGVWVELIRRTMVARRICYEAFWQCLACLLMCLTT